MDILGFDETETETERENERERETDSENLFMALRQRDSGRVILGLPNCLNTWSF